MQSNKNKSFSLINSNIKKLIDADNMVIETVNPKSLITFNRLDIVIKTIYARSILSKTKSTYAKNLYLKHINIINGFVESDNTKKIGKDDFISSFKSIISTLKHKKNFDSILLPVSKNISILDGAHRLASAVALKANKLKIIKTDINGQNYDSNFFLDRGMDRDDLEFILHEYAKLNEKTRVAIFWPASDIKKIPDISSLGIKVYDKKIELENDNFVQLIKQIYSKEKWVGSNKNNFEGSRNKARWCSSSKNLIHICIYDQHQDIDIIKEKKLIREVYGIDEHSVHINDTHNETIELCELLLNKNSIHWLRNSRLDDSSDLRYLTKIFKEYLLNNNLPIDENIILGSTISAYGYGKNSDLDYANSRSEEYHINNQLIELDIEKLSYINTDIDSLIECPKNYYYFDRLKFLSIDRVMELKSNRKRNIDYLQLEIINNINNGKKLKNEIFNDIKRLLTLNFYKIILRTTLHKIRFILVSSIKKLKKVINTNERYKKK